MSTIVVWLAQLPLAGGVFSPSRFILTAQQRCNRQEATGSEGSCKWKLRRAQEVSGCNLQGNNSDSTAQHTQLDTRLDTKQKHNTWKRSTGVYIQAQQHSTACLTEAYPGGQGEADAPGLASPVAFVRRGPLEGEQS